MTTYTLIGTPGTYGWGDPSSWVGGVVPNGPTADVILPVVTSTSTGQPVSSLVTISDTYAIRSIAVNDDTLANNGALSVSGALTIASGGQLTADNPLTVGSLSNQGAVISDANEPVQITSAGAVTNSGRFGLLQFSIYDLDVPLASRFNLTLTTPTFSNTGIVAGLLIETPAGGFTNLQNGTLSGGRYYDIALNVGSTIVTDAADLTLSYDPAASGYQAYPAAEEVDPATGTFVPIESTLRTVAASGSLTTGSYTTSSLTVDGVLKASGIFNAGQLTIDPGGYAAFDGTISGTVINNGRITIAPSIIYNPVFNRTVYSLVIDGPLSGSGSIAISASTPSGVDSRATLELKQTVSNNIVFDDQHGTLLLDQPFISTSTIRPAGEGDQIVLAGVALSSITNKIYAGGPTGGTLSLTETDGTTLTYRFVGNNLTQGSFVLSAGPQPYSTSPPSLLITVNTTEQTGSAFYIDGSQGVQNLVGTGNPNFINTAGAAGTGTVVVDLQKGIVTKGGQTDAILTNIQGVQLGAGESDVTSLLSGTDLIYGGSGTLTFHSSTTVTDYIQGGTGTNIVFGEGTEIFYGNGGHDVMRGSNYANFMSGGATTQSTDVFYGTYGNDYVYGHGGAVDLVGGLGNEYLSGGSGFNELDDRQQPGDSVHVGTSAFFGSTGTDLFYGGLGTNFFAEGSGTDTFVGSSGTDTIEGGSGRSFTYAGSGTTVVTTGAGNDYVKAGTGRLSFNDTAANLHAGRFDYIDNFSGGQSTDLYLPTAVQGATTFVSQDGGVAVLTAVAGGTAEVFAAGADAASVQAHTHFTL